MGLALVRLAKLNRFSSLMDHVALKFKDTTKRYFYALSG
jgi:hypothetical protein